MNPSFAMAAGRLAGLAGLLLGWRPAEFWAATPAELGSILRPQPGAPVDALNRDELARLMEHDND